MTKLMYTVAAKLQNREEGQGMVEYSLILALVSVVAIGTLTLLGGNVTDVFGNASDALGAAAP